MNKSGFCNRKKDFCINKNLKENNCQKNEM